MRFLYLGCLLLGLSWLGLSPTVAQTPELDFTEFTLDNGMHVILHEDHRTPVVVLGLLYHVGSKNEEPRRTGFAHFFEHLMFEGSKNVPRGQFDRLLENAGGYSNAFTDEDQTYYYDLLPSNYLNLGLWLESERLRHGRIDSIGVETQREVVKEERRLRLDNRPYGTLIEEIRKRAYREHPYRWTPIGSAQYIDRATLGEFRDFYRTFYVPQNATLVIAGDIDPEEARERIEYYFEDIPRGSKTIPRPTVTEPPLGGEVRDTVFDDVQLPMVAQAYRAPAVGEDDYYAVSMLTRLLTGGRSARLRKRLIDETQKSVVVSSYYGDYEEPGIALVYSIASDGTPVYEVEAIINNEIRTLQEELIGEREFQKLQNQSEADFVQNKATLEDIAQSLAFYHVFHGDADMINEELARYQAVTREDLRRVAQTYFTRDNRVVLYYLPQPK